jgi:hypothetical protein
MVFRDDLYAAQVAMVRRNPTREDDFLGGGEER